jgi:hypothetical protein
VEVVRHDYKIMQVHSREVPRNRYPTFPDSLSKVTQIDVAIMEVPSTHFFSCVQTVTK